MDKMGSLWNRSVFYPNGLSQISKGNWDAIKDNYFLDLMSQAQLTDKTAEYQEKRGSLLAPNLFPKSQIISFSGYGTQGAGIVDSPQ